MDLAIVTVTFPAISTFTAGLTLLLQLVLMVNVGRVRGATNTLFGAGDERLQQAIRMHGNLAENAGIFIVVFALMEMAGGVPWLVGTLCGVFLVGRIAHAIGLGRSTGTDPLRFAGALGTLLSGLVAALYTTWLGFVAMTS